MSSKTESELKKLKLAELKKICTDMALPISGTKSDLVDRILCHDAEKPIVTVQPDEEAELLDDDDDMIDESPAVGPESSDEASNGSMQSEDKNTSPAPLKAGSKRPAGVIEKEMIRPAKVASIITVSDDTVSKASGTSKLMQEDRIAMRSRRFGAGSGDGPVVAVATGAGRVLDEGKKLERARRFGLPVGFTSPKSDQERLQARAQRFSSEDALKSAQPTTATTPTAADDGERKRKRLEKFGPVVGSNNSSDLDKKKADRAARFGLPKSAAQISVASFGGDPDVLRKRAERFGPTSH